jgi:hypothetical protein
MLFLKQPWLLGCTSVPKLHRERCRPGSRKSQTGFEKFSKGPQPQAKLAWLHEVMFQEEKVCWEYYSTTTIPDNIYLYSVLETKLGLPITLSLIYVLAAWRLGFQSWGVALPGHFLAGIELRGEPMLVDTYSWPNEPKDKHLKYGGRIMTHEEAHGRMKEVLGPDSKWSDDLLIPVSPPALADSDDAEPHKHLRFSWPVPAYGGHARARDTSVASTSESVSGTWACLGSDWKKPPSYRLSGVSPR